MQLLLESGALCERDTFQGERCLYNALNDKIRRLLLEYDYSKSSDPLQPFAAHITTLLTRSHPQTSDVLVVGGEGDSFQLHKFILSARSPYFARKLAATSDIGSLKLPSSLPPQAFSTAIRYLYFDEAPSDVGGGPGTGFSEEEVLQGIEKISKHLEIRTLLEDILEGNDRRYARQRRMVEVERGRNQVEDWFNQNVLKYRVITTAENAENVRWDRQNSIFADVLLRADEPEHPDKVFNETEKMANGGQYLPPFIPVGPLSASHASATTLASRKAVLFPVHRAMLLRSEYFSLMFSSSFREAQSLEYLQIIKIECSPQALEATLRYLYTEKTDIPLNIALDVLYTADLLLIEKLKIKAATIISTLGSGNLSQIPSRLDPSAASLESRTSSDQAELDIYEIIRAGWQLRVPRLEEFGARFMAFRLEAYIDDQDFEDIVRESAARIQRRQETDTIELLDDIRYYLSERFRLRFEDAGIEEMIDEETEASQLKGWEERAPEVQSSENNQPKATTTDDDPSPHPSGEARTSTVEGKIRTLDGEEVDDELEGEAMNYQILLGKIDRLLEKMKLDA